MIRRRPCAAVAVAVLLLAASALPSPARAQERGRTRPRPASQGRDAAVRDTTRRDSTGRDSTGRDSAQVRDLVTWLPSDSVMDALRGRTGYQVTRYQGDTVVFRARERLLELRGAPSGVERGRTVLAGARIEYDDSTQVVRARGDTVVLRDPERAADDVIALGEIRYSIPDSRGVVTNVTTRVDNQGTTWVVGGTEAAIVNRTDSAALARGDTAAGRRQAFYARGGEFTSCTDPSPHYHFSARELKVVSHNVMVGRPAVLYIGEVPVAWIPFFFQDMRDGRRGGLLVPRFGFSEFIRPGAGYRRTVENLGYYFPLGEYHDATVAMDWRSGANANAFDPGWLELRGAWRYHWLSRFLQGEVAASTRRLGDGSRNTMYRWNHQQRFSQTSNLSISANYSTNTQVLRNTALDPRVALGTIQSNANFTRAIGPLSLNLGGSQVQYPGRPQVDRTFPTLSISSRPITLMDSVVWTPSLQVSSQQTLRAPGGEFPFRYIAGPSGVDSVPGFQNRRNTSISFSTPLRIFNFNWQNSVRIGDQLLDYPQTLQFVGVRDTAGKFTRVVSRYSETTLDWETGINLPQFSQGKWNLVPGVSLQNVDGGPFALRNVRSNGAWVTQSKRPVFSLSASPTLFGLFPGLGPVRRVRHSLTPTFSASYAGSADVSDAYLEARGITRVGYLGAIRQASLSLGLAQNVEVKLRGRPDSTGQPTDGEKLRVLSLQTTGFSYNFERVRLLRRRADSLGVGAPKWWAGLETQRFGFTARSDALPGLDLGMDWSLFDGDVRSDSARFAPFREAVRFSLQLDAQHPVVGAVRRLFGLGERSAPAGGPAGADTAARPVSGGDPFGGNGMVGPSTPRQQVLPTGRGWRTSLTFSSQRQRPIRGALPPIDPLVACAGLFSPFDPLPYDRCLRDPTNFAPAPPPQTASAGIIPQQQLPVTNASWNLGFDLTPKWAAQWTTSYDFVRNEFAQQQVTLQRDMHDWRANFSFTQLPTGNVFFSFFISLKAEEAIKFNFDRRTIGSGSF